MTIDPAAVKTRHDMHDLITAFIMPRPIAWVSTVDGQGVYNLAPFSFFTAVSVKPPMVCIAIGRKKGGQKKDTIRNIERSKDFVVNIVDESLAEAMNQTSAEYAPEVDEFAEARLTPVQSDIVKPPRVAESPLNLECELRQILELGEEPEGHSLVLGEVVRFHIRDHLCVGTQVDVSKLKHVGRLGGAQFYCRTSDRFEMERPKLL